MAHLSGDGDQLLVLSVGNVLQVINTNTSEAILKYTNELSKDVDSNDANFISHKFSSDKRYLAGVTGDKKLLVWNIMEKSLAFIFQLLKRPTCICFCNNEDTVIVGDKSGDVYRYMLSNENDEPHLLLGHLSMILDVAVSHDDSFIISADRDEKIRVSFYPNAYNIHSYCLGHTELVSTIGIVSNDFLVSGSGDKTLRLWNYKDGAEMNCFDVSTHVMDGLATVSKIAYYQDVIALIGEGSFMVLFLTCKENSLTYEDSYRLPQQPFDICFLNGKLFVLVRDVKNQIIVLEKCDGIIVEKYVSLSDISPEDQLSTASLPDLKYLTELIRPPSKKRSNEVITPESTINYMSVPNKAMRIEA